MATQEPQEPEVSKVNKIRGNHNFRMIFILVLIIIVVFLLVVWEKARIGLVIALIALLAALGLEVSRTDFDLGTLFKTGSLQESKINRDDAGNLLFDKLGNITTDSAVGKQADEYNCDDFSTKPEAQSFFEKVGGTGNDLNRLDGDKDGEACESLPKGTNQ